jgi:hypothetical protein
MEVVSRLRDLANLGLYEVRLAWRRPAKHESTDGEKYSAPR